MESLIFDAETYYDAERSAESLDTYNYLVKKLKEKHSGIIPDDLGEEYVTAVNAVLNRLEGIRINFEEMIVNTADDGPSSDDLKKICELYDQLETAYSECN